MRASGPSYALERVALAAFLLSSSAAAQDTLRVSIRGSHGQGNGFSGLTSPTADGEILAFASGATNLVANDGNGRWDVFVRDRTTAVTERVSVDSSGAEGDRESNCPSISADGSLVAFFSDATNLVAGDTNWLGDIFVHDRTTGLTARVSVDSYGQESDGDDYVTAPSMSADGRVVAFPSASTSLVSGDTNGAYDVFVHDRSSGITERISVDSSGAQAAGDSGYPAAPAISTDGQIVAFSSVAANLVAGDANGASDIFVHDRGTGITERVSVDSAGAEGNGDSDYPSISSDGRIVAFQSGASNLVSGDGNGKADIFVHDRVTGITELVSVDSAAVQGDGDSVWPSLSADGQLVSFESFATNLCAGDTNGAIDVFLRDRSTSTTERVSVDSAGAEGNSDSYIPAISADGLVVSFTSYASNLVSGDTNRWGDAFVHERCSVPASWSNYGAGYPGTNGIPSLTSRQNPAFGATVTLDLANSYANPTYGLVFIGTQRTTIHSSWGGDLLVVPSLTLFVTFSYGSDSFTGTIPNDVGLCGLTLDLQAIEADPGATSGVSFTRGLELVVGH